MFPQKQTCSPLEPPYLTQEYGTFSRQISTGISFRSDNPYFFHKSIQFTTPLVMFLCIIQSKCASPVMVCWEVRWRTTGSTHPRTTEPNLEGEYEN